MCKEEADKVAVRCGCGRECRSSIRTCVWGSARNAGSCTASSAPTSVSSRPMFGNGVLGPVAALALIFLWFYAPGQIGKTDGLYGATQFLPIVSASFIRQKPPSLALWQCPICQLISFSALLDVLVLYGLAFTHQIGADRDLSGFECGFRMFEECFSDSV